MKKHRRSKENLKKIILKKKKNQILLSFKKNSSSVRTSGTKTNLQSFQNTNSLQNGACMSL